jgi:hypothetical protein
VISLFASIIAIVADDHGVLREHGFGDFERFILESAFVELLPDDSSPLFSAQTITRDPM